MANFLNNITGNGNTQERKSVEFLNVGDVNSQKKLDAQLEAAYNNADGIVLTRKAFALVKDHAKENDFVYNTDLSGKDKWVWVNGGATLTSEKVFLYQSNWKDKNTGKARSRDVFGRRVTLTSGN